MLIENKTNLHIPNEFWAALVAELNLLGDLPLSENDEFGLYDDCSSLKLILSLDGKNNAEDETLLVSYTSGEIEIHACPECTIGFLTYMLLDGLANAWLHQYREDVYEEYNSEELAALFSKQAYQELTGVSYIEFCKCQDFMVSVDTMNSRIQHYHTFVRNFISKSDSELIHIMSR